MARLAVEAITQVAINSSLLAPISFPSTDAQQQRRRAMVKQPNFWKESENSGKTRSCSGWKDFQICTQKQQVNCITKLPWAVCNKIRRQDTPWPQDRNEDKSLTTQRPELCQQAWEKKEKEQGDMWCSENERAPEEPASAGKKYSWFENSADLGGGWGGWVTPIQLTVTAAFQDKTHTLKNGIKIEPARATERRLR